MTFGEGKIMAALKKSVICQGLEREGKGRIGGTQWIWGAVKILCDIIMMDTNHYTFFQTECTMPRVNPNKSNYG